MGFVAARLPSIPLDAYRMCLFQIPRFGSLLYTSFSLVFGGYTSYVGGNFCELNWVRTDLAVFVIILVRTRASRSQRVDSNIPNILNTVTRDAAIYFSVIFTSHFLLVLTLMFVRVCVRNAFLIRSFSPVQLLSRRYGSCQLCKFPPYIIALPLLTLPSLL